MFIINELTQILNDPKSYLHPELRAEYVKILKLAQNELEARKAELNKIKDSARKRLSDLRAIQKAANVAANAAYNDWLDACGNYIDLDCPIGLIVDSIETQYNNFETRLREALVAYDAEHNSASKWRKYVAYHELHRQYIAFHDSLGSLKDEPRTLIPLEPNWDEACETCNEVIS